MPYSTKLDLGSEHVRIATDDPAVIEQLDGLESARRVGDASATVYELPAASAELHFPHLFPSAA